MSASEKPTSSGASRPVFEAIIKVNVADEPWRRAKDIADGLGYACALLMDEYKWTAEGIAGELERIIDTVYDEEAQRAESE